MNKPILDLKSIRNVIDGGYCIGCGVCAAVDQSPIRMRFDQFGALQAFIPATILDSQIPEAILSVCPFSEGAANEDEIGRALYPEGKQDSHVGFHLECYLGHVAEGDFRARGSSGGIGSWVLSELFRLGLIDKAIHVGERQPTQGDPRLFAFAVSNSMEEIRAKSKSRYYPIEMSEVLRFVRETPGRYAIVGVPCFIKAIRLLARQEAIFAERIQFHISIFCGHLKTAGFSEFLAWQSGVLPDEIRTVDFRKKVPNQPAHSYAFEVEGKIKGRSVKKCNSMRDLYGTDWGLGLFKYKACDFCDDVVGETADISVGDAWLPGFVGDWRGSNAIVVRDPRLRVIVAEGIASKRIELQAVEAAQIAKSQEGGFRHRRDGLSYRLFLSDKAHQWRPSKRVMPKAWRDDSRFREIHDLRMALAKVSHQYWKVAKDTKKLSVFTAGISRLKRRYERYYAPTGWKRAFVFGINAIMEVLLPWKARLRRMSKNSK
ncbi:MAG: coenzyme F420 hydrogenase [Verrucomicrobia bacterium]|nr:MAG: coenzyme F420 hydrogenase [Verrucomicrobiota bacterium]